MAVYCVRVLGVAEARETFLPLQLDTKAHTKTWGLGQRWTDKAQ